MPKKVKERASEDQSPKSPKKKGRPPKPPHSQPSNSVLPSKYDEMMITKYLK